MAKMPKMPMPWDSAEAIFTDQQGFMEDFADQKKWDSFDQQYKIASIKLLTKIAFELENLNKALKATSTE